MRSSSFDGKSQNTNFMRRDTLYSHGFIYFWAVLNKNPSCEISYNGLLEKIRKYQGLKIVRGE